MREIRRAVAEDFAALPMILWRGVHEGAAPRYSEAQRQAWLPLRPEPDVFADRIAGQDVLVAQEEAGLSGFMTLRTDGYLDFAYVLPEARGTGTADALLAMLENVALIRGCPRLTTRASDMARPFFIRSGWRVTGPAAQVRDGVTIPATDMTRDLSAALRAVA